MIGNIRMELRLPGCRSLKEKRGILRRFLEHVRRTYGVSVAEIEAQDEHRRAVVEAACVSNSRAHLHTILTRIVGEADRPGQMTLTDYDIQV